MRLDKFLKVSRLIIIEIRFGQKTVKVEVVSLAESTKKEDAKDMFRYL